MMNDSDFIICAVRDKKTHMLGNVFMARNTVEMERDLYKVIHSDRSPYLDFENEFEVCILANYSLLRGISDPDIIVYKSLNDIKNLNMNDREVLDE